MIYANLVYDIVAAECEYFEAIYEDYILELVGAKGLEALLNAKYLETCGVVNGRQLYTLLRKENI